MNRAAMLVNTGYSSAMMIKPKPSAKPNFKLRVNIELANCLWRFKNVFHDRPFFADLFFLVRL